MDLFFFVSLSLAKPKEKESEESRLEGSPLVDVVPLQQIIAGALIVQEYRKSAIVQPMRPHDWPKDSAKLHKFE